MYGSLRTALDEATAAGAMRVGWKIGLTDPDLRARLGAPDGVVGFLLDETVTHAGTARVELDGSPASGAEPELAIWVGRGSAIDAVSPACEVLAIAGTLDDLDEVLAGNVWHRAAVIGEPVPWRDDLLDDVAASVTRNGRGCGPPVRPGEVLGDLEAKVRFAATSAQALGESLGPGEVVLSGLLLPSPVWVSPGDDVAIDFGPLGRLEVSFTSSTPTEAP